MVSCVLEGRASNPHLGALYVRLGSMRPAAGGDALAAGPANQMMLHPGPCQATGNFQSRAASTPAPHVPQRHLRVALFF